VRCTMGSFLTLFGLVPKILLLRCVMFAAVGKEKGEKKKVINRKSSDVVRSQAEARKRESGKGGRRGCEEREEGERREKREVNEAA